MDDLAAAGTVEGGLEVFWANNQIVLSPRQSRLQTLLECYLCTRPVLQAIRLRSFLKFKRYMSKRNRQRLKARIATARTQELNSKRLSHHAIALPQSNYGTRGAMHWR